jgi:hypothetical protein
VFFLLLVAFYLGAGSLDRCDETPMDQGQVCHILCSDGCATAPIPVTPATPMPDPLPKRVYEPTPVCRVLELDRQPEIAPPRA